MYIYIYIYIYNIYPKAVVSLPWFSTIQYVCISKHIIIFVQIHTNNPLSMCFLLSVRSYFSPPLSLINAVFGGVCHF